MTQAILALRRLSAAIERQLQAWTGPQRIAFLVTCSIAPTLLIYWYNAGDISVIFRYWDGPNYLEVAKTLYFVPGDHPLAKYGTTPTYFACHLPFYPALIRLFSYVMGYPLAMIWVTVASAAMATVAFYYLLLEYGCVKQPLYSAALSTILPARWLVFKSVGATEPLFLLLVFVSLIAYKRGRLGWAMIFASLSGITRIVGVLMGVVYFIDLVRTRRYRAIPLLAVIGVPLLLTFVFYHFHFGDFWAYFGHNLGMLNPQPFATLGFYAKTGATHPSEFHFLLYVFYALGVLMLWRWRVLFTYALVFYLFTIFVYHDDVSRYSLAFAHVALIVGGDRLFNTSQFKWLIPLVLYLGVVYAGTLLPTNVVDVAEYQLLLAQPSYPQAP
jgi:hypothetical protein